MGNVPLHHLKIDKSFIAHCANEEYDASIVRAIIVMGHSLGVGVIAEGVETIEQLQFLRDEECDGIQEYIVSKPLPEEAFISFVRNRQTAFPVEPVLLV